LAFDFYKEHIFIPIKSKAQKLPPQAEAIFAKDWRAAPELRLKQRKATRCPNFLKASLYCF
jgi:hypothetical protein